MLLYAGAKGYIDTYPENALKKYEQELLKYVEENHPDLYESIKTKKQIDSAIDEKLIKVLDEFKQKFTY